MNLIENHQLVIGSVVLILFLLVMAYFFLLPKKKKDIETKKVDVANIPIESAPTISWTDRLSKGLGKSRAEIWDKLIDKITNRKGKEEEQLLFEQIEEILYSTDIGPKVVNELLEKLKNAMKSKESLSIEEIKEILRNFFRQGMFSVQDKVSKLETGEDLKVIMIVGVNGAGKTSTIGKLATRLKNSGGKVVVGACDTFRAAAVDQLQVWCDRAGCKMFRAKENADPSGVAFDALKFAKDDKANFCLIDTAGRLHSNVNLMEELKKMKRVLTKLDPNAPHETWLVIDAITGLNALKQAEEFHKALGLTGLIFTKCDGSAKAGNAYSIVQNLQIPIRFIGVGEDVEDLDVFELDDYLQALLG